MAKEKKPVHKERAHITQTYLETVTPDTTEATEATKEKAGNIKEYSATRTIRTIDNFKRRRHVQCRYGWVGWLRWK